MLYNTNSSQRTHLAFVAGDVIYNVENAILILRDEELRKELKNKRFLQLLQCLQWCGNLHPS